MADQKGDFYFYPLSFSEKHKIQSCSQSLVAR